MESSNVGSFKMIWVTAISSRNRSFFGSSIYPKQWFIASCVTILFNIDIFSNHILIVNDCYSYCYLITIRYNKSKHWHTVIVIQCQAMGLVCHCNSMFMDLVYTRESYNKHCKERAASRK